MKNYKSPGSDGITTEFYKIFWQDIKTYFVNSINYSFEHHSLTDLQKQGLITLLPKPDKDLTLLSNWRPISLLNVDYKIATKSIANRIKQVLCRIISPSQTGFIKGRYIGENIRLICEVLDHVDQNDIPSLMFFSDFEKAFDSLDHNFMYKTLRHFNFGDELLQWTELFYTDVKSCILNNGHMIDFCRARLRFARHSRHNFFWLSACACVRACVRASVRTCPGYNFTSYCCISMILGINVQHHE